MAQVPSLPVELLVNIVEFLRPHTPIIGHEAPWVHPNDLLNWWDAPRRATARWGSGNDAISDVKYLNITVSSYTSLLAVRQVSRRFNSICIPLLYQVFNYRGGQLSDEDVITEIVTQYHSYFRTVRIRADLSQYPAWEKLFHLLFPAVREHVTALGVYFDDLASFSTSHLHTFIEEIVKALKLGHLSSFGVYSTSVFSGGMQRGTPEGASTLLEQITTLSPLLSRLRSLDIAIKRMDERLYDVLHAQIGKLHSLTIRMALHEDLELMGSVEQRDRWLTCYNLTSLQLIQCPGASTQHVLYMLQFFPSLRDLVLVSCGGLAQAIYPRREMGWSLRNSLWQNRTPLETFHLERVFEWEILVLGVIHTRTLTVTDIMRKGLLNPCGDEEIYPHLHTLRTNVQHLNLGLEAMCKKRGITIESNARSKFNGGTGQSLH